ncbi:DWNN-domain-containing protein [Tilletiaria anomala UBC 951]|uniref:DWNN-domain-containing protein n=1 Tax=Tilletiaria anomala (strain ATCC 24038 / CBS 436.72 / UBC 951) TaxID=1037660 RepID=A0A066VUQ8_TILAU|nr:DWNN-domain-containing protein [Tilletiaria anomala UBC 951]KDN45447.1 DWNN-domain-containing protein [Tilletiaria anomala UBC 951]
MASATVYYKFKSQRDPSKITFDGTGISVWDIKKEIIMQNKMNKDLNFHLSIFDESGSREYKSDDQIVPRSSLVIVKRLPAQPGKGTAYKYVTDDSGPTGVEARFSGVPNASGIRSAPGGTYRGTMSMRFDGRDAQQATSSASASNSAQQSFDAPAGGQDNADEASKIAAMFQASNEQWSHTQEQMSHATYRERGGAPRRGGPPRPQAPHLQQRRHEPPGPGYICHRCGKKGHWIQDCPTNDMPDWDGKPKLKRTTGIPRSMLKTVEQPTDEQRAAGMMITADGDFVIAQADTATWQKQRGRAKILTKSDVYELRPSDSSLTCALCSRLLRDAVKTPCCGTRFCEECIQNHLLEHDFMCPECEKSVQDLDRLERDQETRDKVEEFINSAIRKSEEEQEAATTAQQQQQADEASLSNAAVDEDGRVGKQGDEGKEETNGDLRDPQSGHGNQRNGGGSSYQDMVQQFASLPNNPMATMMMVSQINARLQDPRLTLGERQRLTGQLQYLQTLYMNQMQAMMTGGSYTQQGITWGQQQAMQATNPFSHRAPNADSDSPYMRTAIGNRGTGRQKRDRPMDSFEVNSGGGGGKRARGDW